jgi:hypothetical protein
MMPGPGTAAALAGTAALAAHDLNRAGVFNSKNQVHELDQDDADFGPVIDPQAKTNAMKAARIDKDNIAAAQKTTAGGNTQQNNIDASVKSEVYESASGYVFPNSTTLLHEQLLMGAGA